MQNAILIHRVATDARAAITFALSRGDTGDARHGSEWPDNLGPANRTLSLLMDKAYENGNTRQRAINLGFITVVSPRSMRLEPWKYDREMDVGGGAVTRSKDCSDASKAFVGYSPDSIAWM